MKKVSLVAIVILLVLTFVLAGAAIAQGGVQYVCYYSGLPSVPQALVMRSVIFEPGERAGLF
jgi:hypothetical protein